jgi:hypothetical protein
MVFALGGSVAEPSCDEGSHEYSTTEEAGEGATGANGREHASPIVEPVGVHAFLPTADPR